MPLHGPASRRPIRRFVVAEQSMLPALSPGQGIIAARWFRRRPGQVRVFRHPTQTEMWLVKRLDHALPDGRWHVVADNPDGGVGSESFGPVDLATSWLVVVVVPMSMMSRSRPRR